MAAFARRFSSPRPPRAKDLEALYAATPFGIFQTDLEHRVLRCNTAFAALLGLPEADVAGRSAHDFLRLDDPPSSDAVPVTATATSIGPSGQQWLLRGDGTPVPVVLSWTKLGGGRRRPATLACFVAERSTPDAELTRRQSFTDALLETIEVGIVSCDADGIFVVSNRAERAMFGLQTGLRGLPPEHLTTRIDVFERDGRRLEPDEYPLMRALRGEDVTSVEVLAGPAGGPYHDLVVRGRQIVGPDGEVLGAVAALTDVTVERAASRALADEHRRLAESQRLGQLGSFEHDFAAGTWTFSDHLHTLWGIATGGLTGRTVLSLTADDDRRVLVNSWRTACREGGTHRCEFRIRRAADGAERLIRSTVEVQLGPDGRPAQGRGTHMDITELNTAEQAARRANAFFNAVLSATPDYTFVTDLATDTVIYGSGGKDVLGLTSEELDALGPTGIGILTHPDDRQRLSALSSTAAGLEDGQVLQIQYRGRHADGRWRWLSRRVTPFRRNLTGRVTELLSVVRDVTDVVEAERRLMYAARHDNLTGLPNRALLLDRLDAALSRSARDGRDIAVLFCDLDGFKNVNDTGGHAAGDAVLLETARRLTAVLRDSDTVARVGGDEFVILVEPWNRPELGPVTDREVRFEHERGLAVQVAERVAEALRQPIAVNGTEFVVTASIGITYAGPDAAHPAPTTADQVLHNADAAMYLAKGKGKNRFEVFAQPSLARESLQPTP